MSPSTTDATLPTITTSVAPTQGVQDPTKDSGDSTNTAAIVGAAVGCVCVVLIIVGAVVYRKRQSESGTYEVDEAAHSNEIIDDDMLGEMFDWDDPNKKKRPSNVRPIQARGPAFDV